MDTSTFKANGRWRSRAWCEASVIIASPPMRSASDPCGSMGRRPADPRPGGGSVAASRSFRQGLVGVFGYPVAENPTQAMLEPAFADMGLDWRYLTVEVRPEDLGDAVRGARAMNWHGFNC